MKSVTYERTGEAKPPLYRYQKGHPYINVNNVIVLCSTDSDDYLIGTTLCYPEATFNIGEHIRVRMHTDEPSTLYEEFHGTITFTN